MEDEVEQTVIGVTECNKWRNQRTKDTERLAKKIVDISAYDKVALISLPPLDLLREAFSCYQNGAYMATAIMCRAVTEAVVYFSLARRTNRPKEFSGGAIKIDFDWIDTKWSKILNDAKNLGIANDKLIGKIEYIRNYGNATVHYGQYEDKAWLKLQHGKVAEAPHGWLGKEKALELLDKTISIFNEVIKSQANTIAQKKKNKFNRFAVIGIEFIVGIAVMTILFSSFIFPRISTDIGLLQGYMQTILTFGGIFIPIVFLIFFELTKQPRWKEMNNNRGISRVLIIILFISIFFVFSALSLASVGTMLTLQHAITFAYYGIGIALLVLIVLIIFYVEIY